MTKEAVDDLVAELECSSAPIIQQAARMLRALVRQAEREKADAFYGGYCCALSAGLYGDDGTSTGYLEAVDAAGPAELLSYARRHGDMELPRIRKAIRFIRGRESYRDRALTPTPSSDAA